jgi:hypothetical protein
MILLLGIACTGADPGFGGGGTHVDPPVDTGPFSTDDTGDSGPDTGRDTGPDTGRDTGPDTAADTSEPRVPGGDDCKIEVGEVACDLVLVDASGASWSLWDQYGEPIALVMGHQYDQHFTSAAGWIQEVSDDRSTAVGSVMIEDFNYLPADDEDAKGWGDLYGIELSLADPDGAAKAGGWYGTQTVTWLIDEDMVLRSKTVGFIGQSQLDDKIKDL